MTRAPGYLTPLQVGVGCPGGCKAAAHSARCYLETMLNNHVFIKLDFSNAFNSMLTAKGQPVDGSRKCAAQIIGLQIFDTW